MALDFHNSLMRFSGTDEMPITHYSPNGLWGTKFVIGQLERIHWFLGLRQAEVEIQAKESDLLHNQRLQQRSKTLLKRRKSRIQWLNRFRFIEAFAAEIEHLELDVLELEQDLQRSEPLIRDALHELEICQRERERIYSEHADKLEGKTFEQIQAEFTPIAALEATAWMVAAEVWAAQQGLPVTVAKAIADLSPDERPYVLSRESELRLGIEVQHGVVNASQVLASLPPERRDEVLLMAAQIVIPESPEANAQT